MNPCGSEEEFKMADKVKSQIQALVDLETKGWNTKNPDLFLSIIHPDMVWPWPPTADDHDPKDWIFVMGRFDRERWRKRWQDMFDSHDLVHNQRSTVKIVLSKEQDAAFAVVDIDTLWRHRETKKDFLWKGRVCKMYTKMPDGEWKFIFQTGTLDYSKIKI
jgi:ketosteroid isomerase-like protein